MKSNQMTTQVTGKCGSVTVRLIPAPRGAGIVAARVPKKVLQMAGIEDCYTCSRGSTKTLGNFVKVSCISNLAWSFLTHIPIICSQQATYNALASTYGFLSPELWRETKFQKSPLQDFSDFLSKPVVPDIKPVPNFY